MKSRIYNIIEVTDDDAGFSRAYNWLMIAAVIASLIPLCFKEQNVLFDIVEIVCTVLFLADYALRWFTADLRLGRGAKSFALYPFTPLAILDLLSILPGLIEINPAFRVLRLARLLKLLRLFRLFRYSKSLRIILAVIKKEANLLLCVMVLAIAYVFVSAMIIFNVEPDTFETFFDAFYWACVSLTTIGYGDLYCVTTVGRVFTIIGSIIGVAVIALPAGIVTGGFIEEKRSEGSGL